MERHRVIKAVLPARVRGAFVAGLRHLPRTEGGDCLFALAEFYRVHGRLPRRGRRRLFNDMMFALRTGGELVDPLRVRITDKELAKSFIAERVGNALNVPTIAILRSPDEVSDFAFPTACVIKPTHMSAEMILRRRGEAIDLDRVRNWLATNFYEVHRERNYRDLEPKVIVEEFALGQTDPNNYKAYCVDGEPRLFHVNVDMHGRDAKSVFDRDWNLQPFVIDRHPPATVERPESLDRMIDIARRLSAGFSFLRVDMYSDGHRVAVGELTNCSGAALGVFVPEEGERLATALLWPDRQS